MHPLPRNWQWRRFNDADLGHAGVRAKRRVRARPCGCGDRVARAPTGRTHPRPRLRRRTTHAAHRRNGRNRHWRRCLAFHGRRCPRARPHRRRSSRRIAPLRQRHIRRRLLQRRAALGARPGRDDGAGPSRAQARRTVCRGDGRPGQYRCDSRCAHGCACPSRIWRSRRRRQLLSHSRCVHAAPHALRLHGGADGADSTPHSAARGWHERMASHFSPRRFGWIAARDTGCRCTRNGEVCWRLHCATKMGTGWPTMCAFASWPAPDE